MATYTVEFTAEVTYVAEVDTDWLGLPNDATSEQVWEALNANRRYLLESTDEENWFSTDSKTFEILGVSLDD